MRFIDTHTHLYLPQFDADRPEVISRAQAAGCDHFFLPNVDLSTIDAMMAMTSTWPGVCHAMMGLHPCSVKEDYLDVLHLMETWLAKQAFSGIGETGIDLYWDKSFFAEQKEALRIQLNWAKKFALPVILHTRDGMDVTIDIVASVADKSLEGIFHCFNGNVDQARRIVDMGFYLGIGGVMTYKNGGLEPVIEAIGLESIVLETDAPYLAPVPFRGKRNESAHLIYVIQKLADVSGIHSTKVAEITSENAKRVFRKTLPFAESGLKKEGNTVDF
jgi:TatD DNase family protein